MTQDYSIQHSDKTVFATCIKTRATCPLTRLFAPLPNIRVLCDQKQNNLFRCSIILRGTPAEIQAAMPTHPSGMPTMQKQTFCYKN